MKSQLIHSTRGKCKKSWSHSLFTNLRLPFVNFLSFRIDSLQFQIQSCAWWLKEVTILFYRASLMEMALTHAVQCMDSEQEALLKIKEGFIKEFRPLLFMDGRKRLLQMERSWMWQHRWSCDRTLSPVKSQDPFNRLQGEISPCLLDLPYLKFLTWASIYIGSLQYIEYLNLSNVNFRGTFPSIILETSHTWRYWIWVEIAFL